MTQLELALEGGEHSYEHLQCDQCGALIPSFLDPLLVLDDGKSYVLCGDRCYDKLLAQGQ